MSIQTILQKLRPIRDYISNLRTKKSPIYLAIVICAFFLALFLIWYFSQIPKAPEIIVPEKPLREQIIEGQLGELEQLRGETQPLTEKEIQRQLKELEKLRQ